MEFSKLFDIILEYLNVPETSDPSESLFNGRQLVENSAVEMSEKLIEELRTIYHSDNCDNYNKEDKRS